MGAEIDRLEVQVEAQAIKANNQLDDLVGKLDALSIIKFLMGIHPQDAFYRKTMELDILGKDYDE